MTTFIQGNFSPEILSDSLCCSLSSVLKRTYIKVGVAAVDLGDRRAVVTSVDIQATAIRVVPVVTTTSEYV